MNAKKTLAVAAALLVSSFAAHKASAQDMPAWGIGDIAAANAQFDANFDVAARQMAWQVALATPNDQPLPFNAMTISQSITEGSNAALGYVRQSEYNSDYAANVAGNYSTYAIQGNAYYAPQYPAYAGQTYELPYTSNPTGSYYVENGYVYQGYQDGGNNLSVTPYAGW